MWGVYRCLDVWNVDYVLKMCHYRNSDEFLNVKYSFLRRLKNEYSIRDLELIFGSYVHYVFIPGILGSDVLVSQKKIYFSGVPNYVNVFSSLYLNIWVLSLQVIGYTLIKHYFDNINRCLYEFRFPF